VALLNDVLQASGGLELWRQQQRFTVHISMGGVLCARKRVVASLRNLVVEGSTQQQQIEINGFGASDRRAVYRPDRVALEGPDGQLLQGRSASPAEFRAAFKSTTWDELQLAHYCGCLIWNYLAVPFILADSDVLTEVLESTDADPEEWRRLRAQFPPRVVTHSADQTFYFDRQAVLRRLDYSIECNEKTRIVQLFSGHQSFSGFLVPTLCRILKMGLDGEPIAKPVLVDIEIFDVIFE
jgi:hypothetical protein